MALVLTTPENGTVDVEIPKNRLGPCRDPFRLRLDFQTAGVTETPIIARAEVVEKDAKLRREDSAFL